MNNLRLIQKIIGNEKHIVRMHEIKTGDCFVMYEDDGKQVGDIWLATEDAVIINEIAGVSAIEYKE